MNFKIDPIIPWAPAAFPQNIKSELMRREGNRSFNYVKDVDGNWGDSDGAWSTAKGPMVSWCRITSNGQGRERDNNGKLLDPKDIKPGFIFSGGKVFYKTYGFGKTANSKSRGNEQVIGYQPNAWNTPHIINNDKTNAYPVNVPCPEISSINVEIQKELYRRATIEWVCFSKAQLEYMTPYFLVPGISCVLEWGWNHYNPDCLLDVADTKKLKDLMNNPYLLYTDHILKSNGNYDVMIGIVTNFDWSIDGNKFKCKTEITSRDRIYAGLVTKATIEQAETLFDINGNELPESQKEPPKFIMGSLEEFIKNDIMSIKDVVNKNSALFDYLKEREDVAAGIKQDAPTAPAVNTITNNNVSVPSSVYFQQSTQNTTPNLTVSPTNTANNYVSSALYDKIKASSNLNNVSNFINYVKSSHPANWKEYVYGIFFGRDTDKSSASTIDEYYSDAASDFDRKSQNELWLNFGLVVDILNYHASNLKFGDAEVFKISIDDIKITAHINMISTDGGVLLIPNSVAPKYFVGGGLPTDDSLKQIFSHASTSIPVNKQLTVENFGHANVKLYQMCNQQPYAHIMRDDLSELINQIRTENVGTRNYRFPFCEIGTANDEGYLKDLYINVNALTDPNATTYTEFIENLLSRIMGACGSFWDLKLVSAAGDPGITEQSTMKIVDTKYIPKNITGEPPYVFKVMSDESILLGMEFHPILSNAVAIRTMYAPADVTSTNKIKLNNGSNELLDYKFKDRLTIADNIKTAPIKNPDSDGIIRGMLNMVQTVSPPPNTKNAYQMTTQTLSASDMKFISDRKANNTDYAAAIGNPGIGGNDLSNSDWRPSGTIIVRRLVLPNTDLLNFLLDDGDFENNTGYTGIMPNIKTSFTLQGIGGLRTFQMFLVELPEPYSKENIVFRITNVTETLSKGQWTTTIVAGIIPLRGYIKTKLGLK